MGADNESLNVSIEITRLGRRAEFGESFAGKQYPKKKMDISGFDDAGKCCRW